MSREGATEEAGGFEIERTGLRPCAAWTRSPSHDDLTGKTLRDGPGQEESGQLAVRVRGADPG
jgi:hypothetical protein